MVTYLLLLLNNTDLCLPNVYRIENSRIRQSFFGNTLMRLTKSCPRYSVLLATASLTWDVKVSRCVNHDIISFCTELGIDKIHWPDMNRPMQLTRVCSGGSSVRPSAGQKSPNLSLQMTGDHSISTSRSVLFLSPRVLVLFARMSQCLTSRFFPQPGSIRTSQDILAHISQLYSVQVSASSSGDASQQALMEDLPPVLIFHLGRVGASGEMKMGESIQLEQELKIPLGTIFSSLSVTEAEYTSRSGRFRNYGTQCSTTLGATGALQALWSGLPSERFYGWRALYGKNSLPERKQQHRGCLDAH